MNKKNYPDYAQASFEGIIGISRKDISPPPQIYARNWGAALHDAADGIHRPLVLVCQTFQSAENDKPLVLISADLGWWKDMEDEKFLREGILKALGLEAWQLMICLSHTHAGPSLCREDRSKPGGEYIEPYLKYIQDAAIEAVNEALSSATPAFLTWNYGKSALATNRDLREAGSSRIVVGYNPSEPADDTLLVGRISDQNGKIIGTIVNYACHPTTLAWDNKLISPDYIGAMRELTEEFTGAPCLFLQGASGELAPAEQYSGDHDLADTHGRRVGYSVLAALEAMLPAKMQLSFSDVVESGAPLAVWRQSVVQSSRLFSAKMIEVEFSLKALPSLEEIEQEWTACTDRVLKERLWRKRGIRKAFGNGEVAKIPLWVWNLGHSFLIGQPNEAYSDFQLELRKHLAPYAVGVVNIVNGYFGYLPPESLYREDMYAVWQTPFAKGSLEILINTAKDVALNMISKT
jgi:hypothetical protein